ncbi:ABC transporter substrate-binding protein [Salinibacterium sp. ZJ70]|uniref:ABC transporter substrate-binding protein n=1 Tax=Salinibacterium sp. ZJ70 TaxID=2708084 RepID=UPI0014212580|nr:ABC transporter substrate-binding protein [Salinibacterium sp. ZJ70]
MTRGRTRGMRALAALAALASAAALTGCTGDDRVVAGSTVTVAVESSLTTLNPDSSYGRASELNADVAYLTGSGFAYPNDRFEIVQDDSFGSAEVVSEDPFTVRYSVSADARWSDGVPITAADLLLAWAANSRALDTAGVDGAQFVDPDTGRMGSLPDGIVHFDGALGRGLELATATPEISGDGRALTVRFDEFAPSWRTVLAPGLPAHVVAARALDLPLRADAADAEPTEELAGEATAALVDAILGADADTLSKIADVWNSGFDLTGAEPDPDLLLASGPYRVSAVADGRVTLTVNPQYRGDRSPAVETLVLRTIVDPGELTRLMQSGEIDIATPAADAELASELSGISGVTVSADSTSTFEHLDLQFTGSKSGHFADERVRTAFLLTLPRQAILDELVAPVKADAMLLDSFVVRPGAPGYDEAVAENGSDAHHTTDIGAAMTLLAEAGVASPEVCILYDPADERRAAAFALIQKSASAAGFAVTDCSRRDWRALLGVPGAYDAALFAWDTTRLGPGASAAVFRSDAALANFSGFSDPRADALIDEILATDDIDAITERLIELDAILWDSAYGAPLFAHPALTAVSDRVEGVTRSPLARGVLWNAWAWTPAEPHAGSATPRPLD